MDNVSIWLMVEDIINSAHHTRIPAKPSAMNEEYNWTVHRVDRQYTGEEVHDARCPTALDFGV
jgi:hypothetical protein